VQAFADDMLAGRRQPALCGSRAYPREPVLARGGRNRRALAAIGNGGRLVGFVEERLLRTRLARGKPPAFPAKGSGGFCSRLALAERPPPRRIGARDRSAHPRLRHREHARRAVVCWHGGTRAATALPPAARHRHRQRILAIAAPRGASPGHRRVISRSRGRCGWGHHARRNGGIRKNPCVVSARLCSGLARSDTIWILANSWPPLALMARDLNGAMRRARSPCG